jgi:HEAT repeat protein
LTVIEQNEISRLIAALEDGPNNRQEAQARLIEMGEAVVDPLIDVVAKGAGQKGWAAAQVLGELADPRAFSVLVQALRADNPMLGGVAIKALMNYQGRDILPYLVQAFPHVHIMTQQNMILAMQQLGDRRAVWVLIEQLSQCSSTSICLCIIQALGKLGDPKAIPAIRGCLNHGNQYVREWAVVTLNQLKLKTSA